MPQGNNYKDFLKNSLKKGRSQKRLYIDYPLVITLEKEAWELSLTGGQNLSPCNHKEAGTHIIDHRTLEDKPTAMIASDTDILIIMINVFASRLSDHDWFVQTKKIQFVNVLRFMITLVMKLQSRCNHVIFVHTGFDKVRYFYRKSKKEILERVLNQEVLAVELLSDVGEHTHLSEISEEKLKRFVLIFVYDLYVLMYILIFYLWMSEKIW